ncbi:MAG: response regulator [Acidobacteria bacterium]|nr:response regulator [Acidobacteriota bacterium]
MMQASRVVLIVEDDADSRSLLKAIVESSGMQAVEACNGVEAIEVASRLNPSLILIDLCLPEMDGLEATRRIRQSQSLRRIPIIAVTATNRDRDALAAGCNECLRKPIDVELFQKILTWFFYDA